MPMTNRCMARARERHHRELQTFVGVHGQRLDTVLAGYSRRLAKWSAQFEAIDALGYRPQYGEAVDRASRFLKQLPAV